MSASSSDWTTSDSSSSSSSDWLDSSSTSSLSFSDTEDGALVFSAVRIINRSSLRNNRPSRRVRETANPEGTASMEADDTEEDESSGPPKERCTICLMTYRQTDTLKQLACGHVFHEGCVSRWLRGNNICPVCRTRLASTPTPRRRARLRTTAAPAAAGRANQH